MKLKYILLLLFNLAAFSQQLEGEVQWSATNKLKEKDYKIKISSQKNTPIFSQFYIKTNSISGFEIFKKNFNNKVENIFLGNASWIENSNHYNVSDLIEFQQMQFDLSEIYTRKYRKLILKNKKEIFKNFNFLNNLNQENLKEFSEERLLLEKETESGTNKKVMNLWKEKIHTKLSQLEEFRFENSEKIKIKE